MAISLDRSMIEQLSEAALDRSLTFAKGVSFSDSQFGPALEIDSWPAGHDMVLVCTLEMQSQPRIILLKHQLYFKVIKDLLEEHTDAKGIMLYPMKSSNKVHAVTNKATIGTARREDPELPEQAINPDPPNSRRDERYHSEPERLVPRQPRPSRRLTAGQSGEPGPE